MEKKSRKKSNIVNGTYIVVGIVVALFIVSMLGTFALLNISEPKEVEISNVNEEQEKTTTPKVIGMEKEKAIRALENANLKVEVIEEASKTVEEGYVISQETESNSFVGDTIKIHVSTETGSKDVTVVNVIGESEVSAKEKLENIGLKVSVSYDKDTSKDNGIVLKQSVDSKKIVEKGTTITITVNKLN